MGRESRVTLGCIIVLCLAAPIAAQPSLQAAMLYPAAPTAHSATDAQSAPATFFSADTLRDDWLGRDKVLHAGFSFLFALSSQYVLTRKLDVSEGDALPVSAGVTLSLGLAKEIADSQRRVRPLFSTRDLVADAFGVALAAGVILL